MGRWAKGIQILSCPQQTIDYCWELATSPEYIRELLLGAFNQSRIYSGTIDYFLLTNDQ